MAGHDGGGLNMTVEGRRGQMADQVGHDVEMIAMTRPTVIAGLTGNLKWPGMTGEAGHDGKQASDRYLL